jgi:Hydantoinase B/oxoprolinase
MPGRVDQTGRVGINVSLICTRAYASYALKCMIAPDILNNWASLAAFSISSPVNILNVGRPAPMSVWHVIGHLRPDLALGAFTQTLLGQVLAEGAADLLNIHMSARSAVGAVRRKAEIPMFDSGGMGARPALDRLSATALSSGAMTRPIQSNDVSRHSVCLLHHGHVGAVLCAAYGQLPFLGISTATSNTTQTDAIACIARAVAATSPAKAAR